MGKYESVSSDPMPTEESSHPWEAETGESKGLAGYIPGKHRNTHTHTHTHTHTAKSRHVQVDIYRHTHTHKNKSK